MADNLTAEQRKKNMQNIKSKDTKIELALRKALWSKGYRYRKNYKILGIAFFILVISSMLNLGDAADY